MFYVGQKVVCINDCGWASDIKGEISEGPKQYEVVTIRGFTYQDNDTGLILKEYPNDYEGYWSIFFRPIETTYSESEIAAVNIDELVKPLKVPEREYA